MTAEDVVYSLKQAWDSRLGHYFSTIGWTRVVDFLAVEVISDEPSPIFRNKQTFVAIVSRNSLDNILDEVGTGHYVLANYQPRCRFVLRPFNYCWEMRPEVEQVEYLMIP